MSDALTCKGCQKRYLWKARYAGQKVKCPCGQVLMMPAQNPAAQAASQPEINETTLTPSDGQPDPPAAAPFELMEDDVSPRTRTKRPAVHQGIDVTQAASQLPADSQQDDQGTFELAIEPEALDSGPKLPNTALTDALSAKPSAVAEALMNREDELTLSPWKEKYIPAAIAIIGVSVLIALWFAFATSTKHAAMGAAGMLLVEVLVLMPIALGAVIITSRVMNISLGPTMPAMVKMAAIAIGSGGVADILFFKMMLSVDFEYVLLLVAFVLHMILLGLPILAIFELELADMVVIIGIIVIPRFVILFGMGFFFPHLF